MATRKLRLHDWLAKWFTRGTRRWYHSGVHDQDNRQHRYLEPHGGLGQDKVRVRQTAPGGLLVLLDAREIERWWTLSYGVSRLRAQMEALIVVVITLAIYLLPTWIALSRHKRNTASIAVLNVFLGWTAIGWVVALIWAVAHEPPEG